MKLPLIELRRFVNRDDGMFGEMRGPGGFVCFSVEPSWRGNTPEYSCIPPGLYKLRVGTYAAGGGYPDLEFEPDPRSPIIDDHIEMHGLNFARESNGCIGPGEAIVRRQGVWSVTNSRATLQALIDSLGGAEGAWLWITNPGECS
jgi:hypothetical protein